MPLFSELKSNLNAQNPVRYLKSAFWLSVGKVASMAVSLLATFYIARSLGPQNFGELSYAQSVLGILALFGALVGSLYRDIVRSPKEEGKLLGTGWIVSFSAAFATSVLAGLYVLTTPHDTLTIWVIGILCLGQFFSPFAIIQNVFYAKTETKLLSISNFFIHVLVSLAKIFAMMSGQGVLILASIMLLEQIIIALVYVTLYIKIHGGSLKDWYFDRTYAKQLISDSTPIMIFTASSMIAARIDQIFIKHYLDMTTVGLYGVTVQLSDIFHMLPAILLIAIFPAIINGKANLGFYRTRLFTLFGSFFVYGIAGAIFLTLVANYAIPLIYGPAFTGSIALVQIYIWSLPGLIVGFAVTHFLIAENLRRIQIISGVLPMLMNVTLNYYLIPVWGAPGAAIATVISTSIYPILPFMFKSTRNCVRNK